MALFPSSASNFMRHETERRTFRNSIPELFGVVGVISTNSHDLLRLACARSGEKKALAHLSACPDEA